MLIFFSSPHWLEDQQANSALEELHADRSSPVSRSWTPHVCPAVRRLPISHWRAHDPVCAERRWGPSQNPCSVIESNWMARSLRRRNQETWMRRSKSSPPANVCIYISEIEGRRIWPVVCSSKDSFYRQNLLISARTTKTLQDACKLTWRFSFMGTKLINNTKNWTKRDEIIAVVAPSWQHWKPKPLLSCMMTSSSLLVDREELLCTSWNPVWLVGSFP